MKTIAYFDSSHDMPEEIIMAAGFTPVKILGDIHKPDDIANQYLSSFFCPIARSWLTEALVHSKEWDGIIVAQGCNTTNRHYDIWRMHVPTPFLYWFNGPSKNDPPAHRFFIAELKRLVFNLEKQYSVKISNEEIHKAIIVSNEIKKQLREIAALRYIKDIPNREYLEIVISCINSSKQETVYRLGEKLEELKMRPEFPAHKKKILLTGTDITYPEWMDILDECNLRVVRDDLSIGERYFVQSIPDCEDPLDGIAAYYLSIPRPATKVGLRERIDYIMKSLEQSSVDAVISQNVKFCEPYAYDSVSVNNALKEAGYKVIHLEREYTPVADHQLINRLMAFTEIL